MAIALTETARLKSLERVKNPTLILEIDGVATVYGSATIEKFVRIGDPGLEIGDTWTIGGLNDVDDQATYISLDGSSTTISQQIKPDEGKGSGVSSVQVALVDFGQNITQLISPGVIVDDMLGRKAKLWLGFTGTAHPKDSILIFRGIVDEINAGAGKIVFNIASPDQLKRQSIFTKGTVQLNGAINDSVTTITVDSTADFLNQVNGPDGSPDASLTKYIRVDDELISYTTTNATQFLTCVRGALGTVAAAHDDDADVESFYRLEGDAMTLALKVFLSGTNGPFSTGQTLTNFNYVSPALTVPNAIFFDGVYLEQEYGIVVGDYITTTGASNGANNVTLKQITDIVRDDQGDYIVVSGVTFVQELDSAATISFRSQYDTLGEGLAMAGFQVDVARHEYLRDTFLSSFDLDIYLKDTIEGKDWIESQLYLPAACFSVPRQTRVSANYHIGPIPGSDIKILNDTNIKSPSKLTLRRTITENFYNTTVYAFDVQAVGERYLSGNIITDATSKTQIPVGNKAFIIKSDGLRRANQAQSLTTSAGNRILNRYAFASEHYKKVEVLYGEGVPIEVGDLVLVDATELKVSDTTTGERGATIRFFEVVNKTLNIKTGDVSLALVDTAFDAADRYGLIGPSSEIQSAVSAQQFVIKQSFGISGFGTNEGEKWRKFLKPVILVRSPDSVTRSEEATIQNVVGNTVTLTAPLAFTPLADDVMELSLYTNTTNEIKLLYGFMSDSAFGDSGLQYRML